MKLGLRWVQVTVLHGGAGEGDFFENWSLGGCPSVLRASSVIRSDDLWGGGNELYLHGSHAERSWLASTRVLPSAGGVSHGERVLSLWSQSFRRWDSPALCPSMRSAWSTV